jgi:hypothetical protein
MSHPGAALTEPGTTENSAWRRTGRPSALPIRQIRQAQCPAPVLLISIFEFRFGEPSMNFSNFLGLLTEEHSGPSCRSRSEHLLLSGPQTVARNASTGRGLVE